MSPRDIAEAVQDMTMQGMAVRTGFRVLHPVELAGGVVDLEFFVEIAGPGRRYLRVAGDRMRQRPGNMSFDASFDRQLLADPCSGVPDLGGPVTVVEIDADAPWRQPIILNEFVRLEDVRSRLAPGGAGCLEVRCHRPLALTDDAATAITASTGPTTDVILRLSVRRDDRALGAFADSLAERVAHGPSQAREPALARLLSLRASAEPQLSSLADHADPTVARRVRQCLAGLHQTYFGE